MIHEPLREPERLVALKVLRAMQSRVCFEPALGCHTEEAPKSPLRLTDDEERSLHTALRRLAAPAPRGPQGGRPS